MVAFANAFLEEIIEGNLVINLMWIDITDRGKNICRIAVAPKRIDVLAISPSQILLQLRKAFSMGVNVYTHRRMVHTPNGDGQEAI